MNLNRYRRELYDRPKASLLSLKVRMVKFGVVEAFPFHYSCVSWNLVKIHLSITTSSVPHTTGCCFESLEPGAARETIVFSRATTPSNGPDVRAGGEEKEWTDCVADDIRMFEIRGDWRSEPRTRYGI